MGHNNNKKQTNKQTKTKYFIDIILIKMKETSTRVWDSDGEVLLIEAAHHLPRWLKPDTAANRVWIRRGSLCIRPHHYYMK